MVNTGEGEWSCSHGNATPDGLPQPMTKAEAYRFIKRAREGLRWVEECVREGNGTDLSEACNEVIGSVAAIQEPHETGDGIHGVLPRA